MGYLRVSEATCSVNDIFTFTDTSAHLHMHNSLERKSCFTPLTVCVSYHFMLSRAYADTPQGFIYSVLTEFESFLCQHCNV